MESETDLTKHSSSDSRPSDAASVAKLGMSLALGLWVASLLMLFGFALLESLNSFKIGAYGWIIAWICVSLIQALYLTALVIVVKSMAISKSIANR